ncbi:hypothetical protein [Bacillus paramycoides]|uniref:hypothetical protein n=1 Tax=Bacillus paramycoides TaxID=2026194 RepID=UPI0037FACCC8
MGILRDSSNISKSRGTLNALWSELLDIDENYAESYLQWSLSKLKTNIKHQKETDLKKERNKCATEKEKQDVTKKIRTVAHKDIPRNISKGDIVHVTFGLNIGDELSDIKSDNTLLAGHYGIVLGQKGFMFLIIPITSQYQRIEPKMTLDTSDLPGTYTTSHVAFAKMKSVHIRRINRIHSIPDGKKTLDPVLLKELEDKVSEFWSINPKNMDILVNEA